jgi:hypothetical protein
LVLPPGYLGSMNQASGRGDTPGVQESGMVIDVQSSICVLAEFSLD